MSVNIYVLTDTTVQFEKWLSFDTNPLYALMHESIYCQVGPLNFQLLIVFFLMHVSNFIWFLSDQLLIVT